MRRFGKQAYLLILLAATGAAAQTAVTNNNDGASGAVPVYTGSSTVGNSPISVSGSNVGIGTPNPSGPLQVVGTSGVLVLGEQSPSSGKQIVFSLNTPGDGYGTIQVVHEGIAYTPLVLNPNGGNIGVGTSTPVYPLDVAGQIHSSSGGIVFPDGTTQATAYTPSALNSSVVVGNGTTGATFGLSGIDGTSYSFDFNTLLGNYLQIMSQTPGATPFVITGTGNVGIGTTNPGATLEVNGSVKLTSGSGASMTYADGTVQSTAWNGTTLGGDYAESIDVLGDRAKYEPGDVIVIDDSVTGKFNKSAVAYSKLVAGVYSTKPGLVGRRLTTDRPDKAGEVPMAMIGIVPTKVSTENGPIERGDLLVSSNIPGYAMKGTDRDRLAGAVIGKALAPLQSGSGVIEVLLALQ